MPVQMSRVLFYTRLNDAPIVLISGLMRNREIGPVL